ncbi:hypothetical protein [Leptospira sp. 'Mane']|uniref:hypothetical protein n=1 Tax=Leptospira sp. 'Mane' TaxID=3387407 RepID=UPI00398B605D
MSKRVNVGKIAITALDGVTDTELQRAVDMFTELGAGGEPGKIQLLKEGTACIVRIATGKKETPDGLETLRGMFQEHVFANKTTIIEDWHDNASALGSGDEEEDDEDDEEESEEEEEDDDEESEDDEQEEN